MCQALSAVLVRRIQSNSPVTEWATSLFINIYFRKEVPHLQIPIKSLTRPYQLVKKALFGCIHTPCGFFCESYPHFYQIDANLKGRRIFQSCMNTIFYSFEKIICSKNPYRYYDSVWVCVFTNSIHSINSVVNMVN